MKRSLSGSMAVVAALSMSFAAAGQAADPQLYPIGEKPEIDWKVSDELGNEGWVPSTLFQLAR